MPQAQEHFPASVVRLNVVGFQFKCLGKGIGRGLVITLLGIHQAEIEMCADVLWVERTSACSKCRAAAAKSPSR